MTENDGLNLERKTGAGSGAGSDFRFPGPRDRVTINGRTGSGKTVFGAWLLSMAPFKSMPYVIVDYKGDELLTGIDRAKEIGLSEKLPREPGIYIIHPTPADDDAMNEWLWRLWRRGSTGLLIDEGYMLPDRSKPFTTILTTGRALSLPVITLSQRPVRVSRYVFSEANYYVSFFLNDKRDRLTVGEFTPPNEIWDLERRLPDFHSRWYDVGKDYSAIMRPVPSTDEILTKFDDALRVRKKMI